MRSVHLNYFFNKRSREFENNWCSSNVCSSTHNSSASTIHLLITTHLLVAASVPFVLWLVSAKRNSKTFKGTIYNIVDDGFHTKISCLWKHWMSLGFGGCCTHSWFGGCTYFWSMVGEPAFCLMNLRKIIIQSQILAEHRANNSRLC